METDEPPDPNGTFHLNYFSTIKLDNGQTITAGAAWGLIRKYESEQEERERKIRLNLKPDSRTLLQKFYDHIHPQKQITPQEHDELVEKLEELEQKRYEQGEKVIISENPYLHKTPQTP